MAGMGYTELLRKARHGRKLLPSPSIVQPSTQNEGVDVVDVDHAGGTPQTLTGKRDRPPHAPSSSGKDLEDVHPHKSRKGSKDKDVQKKHSSHLNLERPSELDFHHFRKDPLLFVADVAKAGSLLISKLKQGEEEWTVGMLLSAKNLWLEGDNLDKTDKLNSAYEYISELRKQLEGTKKKLQESEAALKPTVDALEETKNLLKLVTKERDDALTAKAKADEEVKFGKVKMGELEKELSGLRKAVERDERERDDAKSEYDRIIPSTVPLC